MTTTTAQSEPLISVGMPVYNGERYVADAIESVLAQTEGNFELIIADNASTDKTYEICQRYADQDSRIVLHRNPKNVGAAGNYNLLVEMAKAPYFRWSNADDLIAADSHAECLKVLEAHPEAVISFGQTMFMDEHGKETGLFEDNLDIRDNEPSIRFRRFCSQYKLTNAVYGLMRTDAVRQTNLFGDGSLPAADISFMAELILLGSFHEIPKTLFYRRMHPEASSHDRDDDERQQAFWSANGSAFRLPVLRQTSAYLRYVWRIDLPFKEKLSTSAFLLRRLVWNRSAVAKELVNLIKQ
ncbi:MAG: glycosyltransferase family 2 protein [Woeseiaceae bacterium]